MAFVAKGIVCQNHANNYGIREHSKLSEQRSKFDFKTSNTDVTYEKAAPVSRLQFARQLFNRANRVMPSTIKANSTYRNDFTPKSLTFEHPMAYDICCDHISQRSCVDRCMYAHQPGYQKFLDIYARLDYPLHTNEQMKNGISRRDNITLWNWMQVSKTNVPPQKCIDDVQKSTIRPFAMNKFVPNRGLLTEHREHYRFQ